MEHSRPRAALFEKIALGLIQPLAASEHVLDAVLKEGLFGQVADGLLQALQVLRARLTSGTTTRLLLLPQALVDSTSFQMA